MAIKLSLVHELFVLFGWQNCVKSFYCDWTEIQKQGCLFSFSVRIKIKPAHNSHQGFLSGQFGADGVGPLHPGPLQISPFHLSNYQLSFKFILVREPIQPAHPKKSCFKLHSCQRLGHKITLQWKLCKLIQSSFMLQLKKKNAYRKMREHQVHFQVPIFYIPLPRNMRTSNWGVKPHCLHTSLTINKLKSVTLFMLCCGHTHPFIICRTGCATNLSSNK